MSRHKTTIWVAAAFVALALLGVLAASASSLYDIEDRGAEVFSYDHGTVYEVRILDSVTIYADEESRPNRDTVNGIVLISISVAALVVALVLRATGRADLRRLSVFHLVAFAGAGYLALDELFGIHETVGHNLRFLADVPGVDASDDLIFALYAVPALIFLVYFRDVILASRRAVILFGLAFALLVGVAAFDALPGPPLEEALEPLSAVAGLAGFVVLAADHVSMVLQADRPPRDAPARVEALSSPGSG